MRDFDIGSIVGIFWFSLTEMAVIIIQGHALTITQFIIGSVTFITCNIVTALLRKKKDARH